ncbi:SDR family NAD(P)-dependent oxidoreductase [Actibacterium lipolyticum]|uniref:3-oxoacyl-[acyl-carrier-protein] reductase FabG n=1 Tax=Actibacterium lipolyticum TaxID=1524263 RepID=A0A238L7R0_9RHOB|nr:SDR family NAD(P)-dependent oxidoreductase [Actibacterium lipolyticum]SMX51133.1 3-oxoacyl-[acyl-carrier-protein] reductase FabG [Actibacterium lipolyticum]
MEGQVAVVTGGAQGIGFAVAQLLVKRGVRVVSWDIDPANDAAMAGLNGKGTAIECNIADLASVQAAYLATCDQVGVPTIVVNSAGIAGPNATVEDYDIDAWHKVIDINLNGTFYVNKTCVPGMKSQGYGRIVNVASIAGKEGNPNASAYSASKAGVIGLTKSLGKELAGLDIAVNCVTPAAARTRIFDQMSQEHIDYMLSKIPRGRFLEVEEAAKMIVWIASPENSFTTGGVFDLSGGRATY